MEKKKSKKRLFWLVMAFCLLMVGIGPMAFADDRAINIVVDNLPVTPDVAPFMENDRVLVPIRFVTEPLGATLEWQEPDDANPGIARVYLGGRLVELTMNSNIALVDGIEVTMDVVAKEVGGRTFVPIRFVSENLDATVDWVPESNRVVVASRSGNASNFRYIGYYYDSYSLDALQNLPGMNQVIHFGYQLKADGAIGKKDYFSADKFESQGMTVAQENGITPLLLITGFDKNITDKVFNDPSLRATAITNIMDLLQETGHRGVDLDIESLSVSSRDAYVAFVKELKEAMGPDYLLSLSLTCRTNANQTWLDKLDYENLARYADQCIIMMYDQHYNGGEPGPIAGADWVEESLQYLLQYIPRQKLIMGIGAYGRRWPETGTGGAVFFDDCYTLAQRYGAGILRDPVAGVPYFTYTDANGVKQTVYFEDEQSIRQKTDLARQYRVGGVAVWRLGRFDDSIWQAIQGK